MKKCPSCGRAYSDMVKTCSFCGVEIGTSGQRPNVKTAVNHTKNNNQNHARQAANTVKKTAPKAPATGGSVQTSPRQKVPTVNQKQIPLQQVQGNGSASASAHPQKKRIGMRMLLLVVAVIVAIGVISWTQGASEPYSNPQSQEVQSQNSEYEILMFYAYNGTQNGEKISDEFDHTTLNCLCVEWDVTDSARTWDDPLYMDIVNPKGEVLALAKEYDNHTWKEFFSNATGGLESGGMALDCNRWDAGTYKVIFYQGDQSICYYTIEVK